MLHKTKWFDQAVLIQGSEPPLNTMLYFQKAFKDIVRYLRNLLVDLKLSNIKELSFYSSALLAQDYLQ